MAKESIKLKPVGEYILVEPLEESEKTASGLIIQTSGKERPQKGKIVSLGAGKRDENGKLVDFNIKKGDTVMFKKYSPEEIELNGKTYLLMKETDIIAIIED